MEKIWGDLLLKKVIYYSTRKIQFNWNFIAVLCAFWNPNLNKFQFPEGFTTITLLDVWYICGASPAGVVLPVTISESLTKHYTTFLKVHGNSSYGSLVPSDLTVLLDTAVVEEEELICFYWHFLCKFKGASKSKKPFVGMLPWAITLAKWDF